MKRLGRVALAWVVLLVTGCGAEEPAELAGYERFPVPTVGELAIPEAGGGEFPLIADDGHVLVVYFGFTHCPDVCPTTLADVRSAVTKIDDPQLVDLAMITVDPDRDTDEVLTGYVQSFLDDAHALRSDDDAVIKAAANEFGASYGITFDDEGEPVVSHTDSLYAVNDAGEMVLTWPFGTSSDAIASDLEILLGASA